MIERDTLPDRRTLRRTTGDDAAVAVVVANLLADVLYGWLDPRIRY
ncbi:hypothetical protein ACFQL0_05160 [Haloplanus litoreus]|uniref:Uncharacterized protein n=1 Tax=Haloplanus litoreus TaxID=767515 RepID=A0ABD5ZUN3_9EURY